MTERGDSYRRILFATSAVGGASVLNILLGILRLKVAAIILGSAGIGLIGLLQSLIATGAAIGGLGVNQSATRQIAAGRASGREGTARRALFTATAGLGLASAALVWIFRHPIAAALLAGGASSDAVGWMGLGVGLSIIAGSQTALLAGLGRVADVARVSMVTAVLSTAAAIGFLFAWREQAIIPYLLAVPVASALAGWLYARRAPAPPDAKATRAELASEWRALLSLGAALMVSAIAVNAAQLAVRSLIGHRLGLVELGLFQASATIAITYLGFILTAMSVDFYPRLSAMPPGSAEAGRLVNEQTEVALLLGGPVILALLGLAEWALGLLYTSEFGAAADVLRWQMLAGVLRLASFPLGFALLAAGRGGIFVTLELIGFGTFVAATALLLPAFGVEAAGIGYLAMYLLYLPLVFAVTGVRWSRTVIRDFAVLLALAAGVAALATWNLTVAAIAGPVFALLLLVVAFRRLRHVLPESWAAKLRRR